MYTWCGNTLFHRTFRAQTRESGVQLPTQSGTRDGLATVEQSLPLDSPKLIIFKLTSVTGGGFGSSSQANSIDVVKFSNIVFKAVTLIGAALFNIPKCSQ